MPNSIGCVPIFTSMPYDPLMPYRIWSHWGAGQTVGTAELPAGDYA